MELAAISAILFALAEFMGVASSILLAMMAFTLMARWGLLTVALMTAAIIAADVAGEPSPYGEYLRPLCVVSAIIALCVWYRLRNESDGH